MKVTPSKVGQEKRQGGGSSVGCCGGQSGEGHGCIPGNQGDVTRVSGPGSLWGGPGAQTVSLTEQQFLKAPIATQADPGGHGGRAEPGAQTL